MLRTKITAFVAFVFLCIYANPVFPKSVFVISAQDDSIIKPFLIDANHVTWQTTAALPNRGGGAIALELNRVNRGRLPIFELNRGRLPIFDF